MVYSKCLYASIIIVYDSGTVFTLVWCVLSDFFLGIFWRAVGQNRGACPLHTPPAPSGSAPVSAVFLLPHAICFHDSPLRKQFCWPSIWKWNWWRKEKVPPPQGRSQQVLLRAIHLSRGDKVLRSPGGYSFGWWSHQRSLGKLQNLWTNSSQLAGSHGRQNGQLPI